MTYFALAGLFLVRNEDGVGSFRRLAPRLEPGFPYQTGQSIDAPRPTQGYAYLVRTL
jgi:hypothetical protein